MSTPRFTLHETNDNCAYIIVPVTIFVTRAEAKAARTSGEIFRLAEKKRQAALTGLNDLLLDLPMRVAGAKDEFFDLTGKSELLDAAGEAQSPQRERAEVDGASLRHLLVDALVADQTADGRTCEVAGAASSSSEDDLPSLHEGQRLRLVSNGRVGRVVGFAEHLPSLHEGHWFRLVSSFAEHRCTVGCLPYRATVTLRFDDGQLPSYGLYRYPQDLEEPVNA